MFGSAYGRFRLLPHVDGPRRDDHRHAILLVAGAAYYYGWRRALDKSRGHISSLHSLPGHYAWYAALLCAGPALALWFGWLAFGDLILQWIVTSRLTDEIAGQSPAMLSFFFADVKRMAAGLAPHAEPNAAMEAAADLYRRLNGIGTIAFIVGALALAMSLALIALSRIKPTFRARNRVENWATYGLLMTAAISVLTTAGIVFSVLFESIRFFQLVPLTDFLFGTEWSPQTAIRADQVGSSGAFGAIPLFAGTLLITVIAMLVAGPLGLPLRSTLPSTPIQDFGPWPSRCWRSWPACRRWSTGSSPP